MQVNGMNAWTNTLLLLGFSAPEAAQIALEACRQEIKPPENLFDFLLNLWREDRNFIAYHDPEVWDRALQREHIKKVILNGDF